MKQIQTITTDTDEFVTAPELPAANRTGDGYDCMEILRAHAWRELSSRGCDGCDLGHWPYVIVAFTSARPVTAGSSTASAATTRATPMPSTSVPARASTTPSPATLSAPGDSGRPKDQQTCPNGSRPAHRLPHSVSVLKNP